MNGEWRMVYQIYIPRYATYSKFRISATWSEFGIIAL